jgi:DNA anti-recombination protein RmuC
MPCTRSGFGMLRAIAYGWRQEALAVNAQEVAELGKQLYERIASLAGHWSDVGHKLGKAVDSYNKSVGALETRVLVTAGSSRRSRRRRRTGRSRRRSRWMSSRVR